MGSETIRLVVPGNPPRKDDWYRPGKTRSGKPTMFLKKAAKGWISECDFAWRQLRRPPINWGAWAMSLDIYVKLRRELGGDVFPHRDCDSSVSCVLDALQRICALDDDVRIAPILLDRHHDSKNPRTVITLRLRDFDD